MKNADTPSLSPTGDPWLLTPGPLTTSPSVKAAMAHDWGSRDTRFIELNRRLRQRLVEIVNGAENYTCVPLQGSGTFVVEAMLVTLVPCSGKVLLLINGAYGKRIQAICQIHGRAFEVLEWPEDQPVDPAAVKNALDADPALTHICAVHCETTSGIINPVHELALVAHQAGRRLIIDAMSAFGAIDLNARQTPFDAVVASSNKCLEGSPGMGFCIVRKASLLECLGNADSLVLDLHDQWCAMEANDQWRFTPPTHCILALDQALNEFDAEGGVTGRGARYRANCEALVSGMRAMGFETLLSDTLQAPIIVTFHMPADINFDFSTFYSMMGEKGFVIYPGKLTVADSFRIGCIGRIGLEQINGALAAIRETLQHMGVRNCGPAKDA